VISSGNNNVVPLSPTMDEKQEKNDYDEVVILERFQYFVQWKRVQMELTYTDCCIIEYSDLILDDE
jgi:hypothetical protein